MLAFRLLSLQVGLPQTRGRADAADLMDREWTSGIHKTPVAGPVAATVVGLAGDGQADLKNHGGPDKALNAYPSDHFVVWRTELGRDCAPGSFGENFTTQGATESDVCIGDIFQVGGLVVQISQPRQPCWKLARLWRIADLAARVERTGRTGWYFRVLQTGAVKAGDDFLLTGRPFPQWSVAEANEIMYRRRDDIASARALATCPALSESWRTALGRRGEAH
jgi:MOSC domain-containing protein YiiM